jgi:hypothetical protein
MTGGDPLPVALAPCRGGYREIVFTVLGDGSVAWWFAGEFDPAPPLSEAEAAMIEHVATAELRQRQQQWRAARAAKPAGGVPYRDSIKHLGKAE